MKLCIITRSIIYGGRSTNFQRKPLCWRLLEAMSNFNDGVQVPKQHLLTEMYEYDPKRMYSTRYLHNRGVKLNAVMSRTRKILEERYGGTWLGCNADNETWDIKRTYTVEGFQSE